MKFELKDIIIGVILVAVIYLMFFKPEPKVEIDYDKYIQRYEDSKSREAQIINDLNDRQHEWTKAKTDNTIDSLHNDFLDRSGFN